MSGRPSPGPVHVAPPGRTLRIVTVRTALIIVVLLLAAYLLATIAARTEHAMHPTLEIAWPETPHVIAHRGGAGLWPEATRYAFTNAAQIGVDALEMDVHLTRDGELVVIHDATVDRTTDGTGAVKDLDVMELARLDAGAKWDAPREPGSFPYRGLGEGVPRFVDVARDHPNVPLLIEIKPDGVETAIALCEALRQEGRTGDAIVGSFHIQALAAFRAACPEVATGAAPNEVRNFLILARMRLAGPYRPAFDVLQVPVRQGSIEVVTPSFVRAAHAKGVAVHVWTVDEVSEIERLLDLGVDGIITDRPDRALTVVGRSTVTSLVPEFVEP